MATQPLTITGAPTGLAITAPDTAPEALKATADKIERAFAGLESLASEIDELSNQDTWHIVVDLLAELDIEID